MQNYISIILKFPCIFFLFCVLSVLVVVNHYMAFQYFAQEYYPFSEVKSAHIYDIQNFLLFLCCLSGTYSGLYYSWYLNQGAGLLHHLPLGDPFRFLCVFVSGWKCASVHHAARRWDLVWMLFVSYDRTNDNSNLCKCHKCGNLWSHVINCAILLPILNKYRIWILWQSSMSHVK